MSEIVWGNDEALNDALADWLAKQCGFGASIVKPYRCMGVFESGELIGVWAFNGFNSAFGRIEMHGAGTSKRWLTRRVIQEMGQYIIEELGCQIAYARCAESDTSIMRMLTAVGFDHVVLPRMRGRNENERLFYITDDAWKSSKFNGQVT